MRIALIDDEVVIVNGVNNMIARLRGGRDEVSAFTDFAELLRFLESHSCDLLISDICMENCDGFQVIEQVKKRGLCENFAIISGFDDFSYAKKSIEMSVVNYLLKPIEETELLALIEKAEQRTNDALEKKTAALIKDFIDGHIAYEQLIASGNPRVTAYEQKQCCAVRCSDKDNPAIFLRLKEEFEEVLRLEGVSSAYYFVLAEKIDLGKLKAALQSATSKFCTVSDAMGLKELSEGYLQCKRCGEFRPFFEDKGIILCSEIDREQTPSFSLTKLNTQFFVAVWEKGSRAAEKILIKLLSEMSAQKNPYFLEGFISRINDSLKVGANRIRFREYADCQALAGAIIKSVDTGKKMKKTSDHFLLDMALAYIERNYCKAITLATVSNEISVNYYYLSRLFKEQMQMNFKQYLTEKRMARAVELLKDPSLKVYDIAQMCGYENVNTFNEAFKCAYLVTPTEYRLRF